MKLRCSVCRGTFQWKSEDPFPEDCPIRECGAYIGIPDGQKGRIAAPFIPLQGGARTKSIDQVYRDAEKSSEARIEQAVAMTPGASRDDFAQLKLTDYRSNMVEGEAAVKPLQTSPEFNRNVAALQSAGVPVMASGGMNLTGQAQAYSAQSRTGPEPSAGARAMKRLRAVHTNQVDPRMSGAISTLPALETQQPGYVPRA